MSLVLNWINQIMKQPLKNCSVAMISTKDEFSATLTSNLAEKISNLSLTYQVIV